MTMRSMSCIYLRRRLRAYLLVMQLRDKPLAGHHQYLHQPQAVHGRTM